FRSPLLTESLLFSLPTGTEMFHFPAFPPHRLYIQRRVTVHHHCWVSPFGHPRITARLTAPRGLSQPPTSFIGSWCQGIHRVPLNTYNTQTYKDARVHCPVLKQHTHPTDTRPARASAGTSASTQENQPRPAPHAHPPHKQTHPHGQDAHGPVPSKPNSMPTSAPDHHAATHPQTGAGHHTLIACTRRSQCPPKSHPGMHPRHATRHQTLLRKEVIQPHLPVRLPCYDFVPIADPTFDGSLPTGVGPPASGVPNFHDVTGGVYSARERIHRSVAALRLLAAPTSWGRVADPNPN